MARTRVKANRDIKTPLRGMLVIALITVCFVFLCELVIVLVRFIAG